MVHALLLQVSECLGLLGGTFLQEGVALAAGAALIANGHLPAPAVAATLFAGIVLGDCAIYGLGAFARRSEWARRRIAHLNLGDKSLWQSKSLLLAVPLCHLVPWLLFPTFVAFGWFKIPFWRFALTSVAFSALFVPLALYILTRFGGAIAPLLGARPWFAIAAAGLVVTALIVLQWRRRLA